MRWLVDFFVRRWMPGWLMLSCVACAGSLEATRPSTLGAQEPSPYCQGLDSKRQTWGAVAKGAAVLAGASGVSTLPLQGDRYETARIGVAAGGIGAAAVAAGAVFLSESAGDRWAEQCALR